MVNCHVTSTEMVWQLGYRINQGHVLLSLARGALTARCGRRRIRVTSFSVHCPGNIHRNKKYSVPADPLTPLLSIEERLRHRHIEPGLSLRAGSSMSNKRYLYSTLSCPIWRSKHSYMPP